MDSPECTLQVSGGYLFLGSKVSEMGEAEKCPHPTKWYPYNPNWKVGNDSPMGPLRCRGVRLLHTSKTREIISDL